MSTPSTIDYGKPVQHKRRRKLAEGWSYDSSGCLLSPRRQLVFKRRLDTGGVCYVEGDLVQLWDALERIKPLARKVKRTLDRSKDKTFHIGVP